MQSHKLRVIVRIDVASDRVVGVATDNEEALVFNGVVVLTTRFEVSPALEIEVVPISAVLMMFGRADKAYVSVE